MTTIEGVTIPAELAVYPNGCVPAGLLVPVGYRAFVAWPPVARAFAELRRKAAEAGIELVCTGTVRFLAEQEDLFRQRYTLTKPASATSHRTYQGQTWWLRPGEAKAAKPGGSLHGYTLAIDFALAGGGPGHEASLDEHALAWLRANAPALGWAETVHGEPWHWALKGWRSYVAAPPLTGPPPAAAGNEEDDMVYRLRRPHGFADTWAFGADVAPFKVTQAEARELQALGLIDGIPPYAPSVDQWAQAVQRVSVDLFVAMTSGRFDPKAGTPFTESS